MVKAIRMPDLHQFKPGFFDLSARCGGWELEHLIIVREAFLPHGCLRLWQGSVAELSLAAYAAVPPPPRLPRLSGGVHAYPVILSEAKDLTSPSPLEGERIKIADGDKDRKS